ncbi:MAG TPA: tRNA 2-thiouridine(34) synthase MnmA [Phycisphaerales bacterium]|nr:tRNA 2-thiouridine(34) synthase MnmA [Phycisphaerales bacterium]
MSGGVDSSVAAAMLVEQGHDVVGVFMRLGSPGETLDQPIPAGDTPSNTACNPAKIGHRGCCSINDAADARLVAAQLGIPLYVCNFKQDFGRIIDYFVDEYAAGRTPNPCVRCNDWLKFGKLHDYARQIGADAVASGHYARVIHPDEGRPALARGLDRKKDQSYVLFGVTRERLGEMILPVGGFTKPEIREKARALGLPVSDKPDSQEICFVPDDDYAGLVERRRPDLARPGPILDTKGNTLGTHAGQHRFTVGQRRGVGVALGHPIYVVDRDPETNTVTVGGRDDLLAVGLVAREANWLNTPPEPGRWCTGHVQFRYNSPAKPARFRVIENTDETTPSGRPGRFEVRFDDPAEAVAPGQAAVIYDEQDETVLGGGWIERVIRADAGAPATPSPRESSTT